MPLRTLSACRRCQQFTKDWQHFRLLLFFFFFFFLFVFLYVHMGIFPSFYSLFFSFTFFVGNRNRNREGHDLRDAVFGRVSNIM
ncbi:hypothetical protein V1504DRAFT_455100 [Lipomyces starkeyi]